MDYRSTAQQILSEIGGEKNVSHLEHCSTRLRFTLRDNSKARIEELKKIPGVLGVVMTAQCQIVIGNNVVEVFDALMKLSDFGGSESAPAANPEEKTPRTFKSVMKKIGSTLMDFLIGVFQPLVPAIAGAGMLKSLLLLINMICGWFGYTEFNSTSAYLIINTFADAGFYFLPLLVADSVATKLKCNRYVSISAVAALLLPNMVSMINAEAGMTIFGLTVTPVSYQYLVFPAILTVIALSFVEKLFNKISPKPIRIFFVPMMCLLIVVPLALVAFGPFGYLVGEGLSAVIVTLYNKLGWIAVMLLAGILPFMIATGMHKAMIPYALTTYTSLGREILYLPASLAHNIAESGACFGTALRTKDTAKRSTAFSAGVSALFGITEPALYGVTLQNKRALVSVIAGALCGGAYIGITKVAGFAVVGPGLASLSMFIDESASSNIINAIIGFGISFAGAFIAALLLTKEKTVPVTNDKADSDNENTISSSASAEKEASATELLLCPIDGQVIPLGEVPDEVFATGVLGEGAALLPETGEVYAPADGTVDTVFDSRHAISMTTEKGAELLIHFGLETVKLNGSGFEPQVKNGEKIKAGQLILKADLAKIKEAGYNVSTPVVIANSSDYFIKVQAVGKISHGETFLTLTRKEN